MHKRTRSVGAITVVTLALAMLASGVDRVGAADTAKVGAPAPAFQLRDTAGTDHALADYAGRIIVLEWLNHDCPFVKKHYESGNMQRLQRTYTEKGVVWFSVNSSAEGKQGHYPPAEADRLTEEKKGAATALLLDPTGEVGRRYGAKTTPHMFVIDPKGVLVYAGAIDSVPSTDVDDVPKATNHVAAALDEVLTERAVTTATSVPYGCAVKYAN